LRHTATPAAAFRVTLYGRHVDLSGIIFVVLALAWAVYLIPKALKHHDEIARTRSIDRFSTAMRVLARREPVDRRNARLVVTPPRDAGRVLLPTRAAAPTEEAGPAVAPISVPSRATTRRAAARAAARRRRHVLTGLLVVDLTVAVLAAVAVLLWWAPLIPVALTAGYLYLCRRQVSRENDASWTSRDSAPAEWSSAGAVAPRRAIRVEAPYGTPQSARVVETEVSPDEDTIQIPVAALDAVAVSVETVDGGSLWDPLPVTLPTYVGKARAARTVRTIDLNAPDTWTSGRDEADSALVEQAVETAAAGAVDDPPRRAVGS
jgi:hypothetical protein